MRAWDHSDFQGSPASGEGTPATRETSPAIPHPGCAVSERDWCWATSRLPEAEMLVGASSVAVT
jgi:hypothetical protein